VFWADVIYVFLVVKKSQNYVLCYFLQLTSQGIPGSVSSGVKRPGREADHSPPSGAEVKNPRSYTSTSPIRSYDVVSSYAQE
jgi:hypothetical protein